MASTTSAMRTRPASTDQAHCGGAWIGSLPELPAIAANTRISRTCRTNATTWATPTLAAAAAAGIFWRCRYLMFSVAPPTAAGGTSVTKELASWASRVRRKLSRPATNPISASAAPT
jgi:hypothetical protein